MSDLTILSDAELDAVSGGTQTVTGGAGGAGGTAIVGASVTVTYGGFSRSDLSVERSVAISVGGSGGRAFIINR